MTQALPFNGAPRKPDPKVRRVYRPVLGEDGRPVFEVPAQPIRVARPDHPLDLIECPIRPPIVGVCLECGTRRPDRIDGICPGECDHGATVTAEEFEGADDESAD